MKKKTKILIFSGAGIDKESGIETFRDSNDGLWNNYKIEEVATISGWRKDRQKVLDFYNDRRRQLKETVPNTAHKIIADLERDFDVTILTQNVTDLHERAGSTNVIHLHGELKKVRSTLDPSLIYDWQDDVNIGDKCERGSQLRPHIIWFNEELDTDIIKLSTSAANKCDVCIIIGTSMAVSPANQLPFLTKSNTLIYYIDPSDIDFNIDGQRKPFFTHFKDIASVGMEKVKQDLIEIYL
jgi:NAD-dependent deacetylase